MTRLAVAVFVISKRSLCMIPASQRLSFPSQLRRLVLGRDPCMPQAFFLSSHFIVARN